MSIFKLMTFNVRGSRFSDGVNVWPNRAALNIAVIKRYAPHLIGFQEIQAGNLVIYREHFAEYEFELGPRVDHLDERYQQNVIFWDPRRFEKQGAGGFYLSQTPEIFSGSWDTAVVRGANWLRLRDRETGAGLFLLNTHLDHISEEARLKGSALILDQVAALAGELPVAITGDFNSRAWGPPGAALADHTLSPARTVHKVYTDAGFSDAFEAAGNANTLDTNTFHGFRGEGFPKLGMRIDWIMLRDGERRWGVASCHILRDENPPFYPSDHYPVLAELTLEP